MSVRSHIRWIMILAGVLTASMIHAAIAPDAALLATFGETLDAPAARLVVRNWGILIALVGGMLIYGAFRPPVRTLVLVVASLSKASFIALVLAHGTRYLGGQAGMAVLVDSIMIAVFAWYLVADAQQRGEDAHTRASASV